MIEVRLPEISESMSSARLSQWLKREGESVQAGEPLLEIETDKTTVEVEAPASGVLRSIHVVAGANGLAVGQVMGIIHEIAPAGMPVPIEDAPVALRPRLEASTFVEAAPEPDRPAAARGAADSGAPAGGAPDARVSATPLARRMASATGLALTSIQGTGLGGKIGKADVERVLAQQSGTVPKPRAIAMTPLSAPESETPAAKETGFGERPLSAMRRVAAARLLQSKQTIPHFYLQIDCVIDELLTVRDRINASAADTKLTVTDFAIRAAALALRKVPAVNASWAGDAVRIYASADIAVAVNTPNGLITPIIRSADRKTLGMISYELKALTTRARAAQLRPEEYNGGTFTISNLGMFGVSRLYAIVNPPQSAILGIGAIERRPIVHDDRIEIGTVVSCTLSADHRVIEGAVGAELLAEFRRNFEQPWLLIL